MSEKDQEVDPAPLSDTDPKTTPNFEVKTVSEPEAFAEISFMQQPLYFASSTSF